MPFLTDAGRHRSPGPSALAGGLRGGTSSGGGGRAYVRIAAAAGRPGVAYPDLRRGEPDWLTGTVGTVDADVVVVTPHWGPNMTAEPISYVRSAAGELIEAGATLVAGHSAHVFHGVAGAVLYDLGDFIDDYWRDSRLRNDLGLLWLVTVDEDGPVGLEAVPLRLEYAFTRLADGDDAAWIRSRFRAACARLGTDVVKAGGRLVVTWCRRPSAVDRDLAAGL